MKELPDFLRRPTDEPARRHGHDERRRPLRPDTPAALREAYEQEDGDIPLVPLPEELREELEQIARPLTVLQRDCPCTACGYNLRGLRTEGRCPECGQAVRVSLSQALCLASPEHAERLARAVSRLFWSEVMMLLGCVPFVGLVGLAFWMVSLWMVTGPDVPRAQARSLAWAARLSLIVGLGGAALAGLYVYHRPGRLSEVMVWTAALVAMLVPRLLLMLYLRRLARAMGEHRLAVPTTVVMWGLGTSLLLAAALFAGGALAAGRPAMELALPPGLAGLFFHVWWVYLVLRYEGAVNEQASIARAVRYAQSIEKPAQPEAQP